MADPEEPKPEAQDSDSSSERADPKPEPKPAKKKKAEASGEGTEQIRDRNKRIREEAAAKRRAKREGETARRPTRNLDTSEVVDDALARSTHALGSWFKEHFNVVQWVIVAALVGWIGYEVYDWRTKRSVEKASDELSKGLNAENGIVGEPPPAEPGIVDPRRVFPTEEERLEAAAQEYRALASGKSDSAILAKLALAGVLYDSGKFKEAKEAYDAVRASSVASKDRDVKGRALEGLGMTLEALDEKDAAIKAFRELENTDTLGFTALGLYHQARVLHAKGENDKAKDLLGKADAKLTETKNASVTGYLAAAIRELMQLIDPAAAATLKSGIPADIMEQMSARQAGQGADPEKLQELLRKIKDSVGADGGAPAPAPPASAP